MEPANLTPTPDEDEALAALLRSSAPALPDDGFSPRVLTALPLPRTVRWAWPQITATALGAAAGLGFAYFKGASLSDSVSVVGTESGAFLAKLNAPGFAFALALTGVSLLIPYVLYRQESRYRPRGCRNS